MDEPDVWLTNPEYYEEVYDAITGAQLDPSLVAKARIAEMTFLFDQLKAYKSKLWTIASKQVENDQSLSSGST